MKKLSNRIILIILLIISIQFILLFLFPSGGEVAGFLYLPGIAIFIFISSILGVLINQITTNVIINNTGALILVFLCSIASMNYLYGKEKPITQIKKGIRYLKNPEEIEYKNVFGLNYQENVINVSAAIAKYENCLPEFGFRITYCCESFEENYFGKSNGEYFSGKGITIIPDSLSASKSLIFKDNYLGKEIEFSILEDDLFEKESIHLNIKKQNISINIYKCKFEPESGFGKLYFNIFNRFIKAKNCE